MLNIVAQEAVARWTDPKRRPPFKGNLIDKDGCKCAQGDVLAACGWTDARLRKLEQNKADIETAKLLGISRTHSILLRSVNDKKDGCPQDVLTAPEKVLGEHAPLILSFWLYLDSMTNEQRAAAWDAAGAAAWDAAGAAAWVAARAAAWDAAGAAAWDAARAAAWDAAGAAAWVAAWASNEIQGHEKLDKLFFLPMFGLTIEKLKEMTK